MVSNCIVLYHITQSRVLSNLIAVYCTVSYVIPSANTEGAEGRCWYQAEVCIISLKEIIHLCRGGLCLSPGCIFTLNLDYHSFSSSLVPRSQRNCRLTFVKRGGRGSGRFFFFFTLLPLRSSLQEVGTSSQFIPTADSERWVGTSARRGDGVTESGAFSWAQVRDACLWSADAAGRHRGLLGNQGRTGGGKLKASGLHRWETARRDVKCWKSRVIGAFWGVFFVMYETEAELYQLCFSLWNRLLASSERTERHRQSGCCETCSVNSHTVHIAHFQKQKRKYPNTQFTRRSPVISTGSTKTLLLNMFFFKLLPAFFFFYYYYFLHGRGRLLWLHG